MTSVFHDTEYSGYWRLQVAARDSAVSIGSNTSRLRIKPARALSPARRMPLWLLGRRAPGPGLADPLQLGGNVLVGSFHC